MMTNSFFMCIGIKRTHIMKETIFTFNEKDNKAFISADYTLGSAGEKFSEIFGRYLQQVKEFHGMTQKDLSVTTGLKESEISMLKAGSRVPTFSIVITLCLAMRLPYERSEYMLRSVGHVLNDSEEHRIHKLFLYGCAFSEYYNIENCNKTLRKYGYTTL